MHYSNPRLAKNNFDFLRLLFAGTVCLVHAYQLSLLPQLGWISTTLSSAVAVKCFFVVSGFLIFPSYERSTSLASYLNKRIRRIYPAYFAVVVCCAIFLAAVSSKSGRDYFGLEWIKYLAANLTFLNFFQPTLPGIFDSNPAADVNGALWTLKIEMMFYFMVPFIVLLFRKFSRLLVISLLYFLSAAYAEIFHMVAERTGREIYAVLGRQMPGQLCYFLAGAFLYYYLPLFESRVTWFLAAAFLILVGNLFFPLPLFEPIALASVVVFFGLYLFIGNFGKYGDFSYGLYIIHFPVIQLLLHLGWFRQSPWLFLSAVIFISIAGAFILWHLVEKRFLLCSSHYISATSSST